MVAFITDITGMEVDLHPTDLQQILNSPAKRPPNNTLAPSPSTRQPHHPSSPPGHTPINLHNDRIDSSPQDQNLAGSIAEPTLGDAPQSRNQFYFKSTTDQEDDLEEISKFEDVLQHHSTPPRIEAGKSRP
jgi:hypothetical protein